MAALQPMPAAIVATIAVLRNEAAIVYQNMLFDVYTPLGYLPHLNIDRKSSDDRLDPRVRCNVWLFDLDPVQFPFHSSHFPG
jgi:hypothetical protein